MTQQSDWKRMIFILCLRWCLFTFFSFWSSRDSAFFLHHSTMCFIAVCWFCVLIDVILTSWIIISKMRRDRNVVEATSLSNVLFRFKLCFAFVDRARISISSLNRRLIVNTFFLCFSARIILFISFLMNNALMSVFSSSFLILYINVLFFLSSFNCLCWFRLMNFASSIVVAFSSSLLFVFVVAAYDSIVVVVLLMFCSMFLNLLFIFLNFTFIAFFTISVDSNTITRRRSDSCKLESIMFIVLSRSKVCISFSIWAFRLNRDKSARAFCVFATSSRRLFSDDITSIFTDCYASDVILKTKLYECLRSV